jgi:hypothetical protein
VIWKLIGGFFAGLVAKLGSLWLAFKAGKASAENRELRNEVDAAERITEARGNSPDSREQLVERLRRSGGI